MKELDLKKHIENLCGQERFQEAIDSLSEELLKEETAESYMMRGDIYRKIREFGRALGDYRAVLVIEPENVPASTKIGMVENILSIENTLYYENAYTDESLFPEM
ncbi:MAG: hypothetical protein PHR20_02905 [Bacteroidales bacterium]|nr:hypothetical protein [Bacteroidales bacterium]